MAIRVALNHRTSHRYARDVWLSPQVVRLRPAPHCRTPILSYSLTVKPKDHFVNWQQDPYSNHLARLVFPKKTREFCVEVDLVAEMTVINPFDFFLESYAEEYPFQYDELLSRELPPYLAVEPAGPKLAAFIAEVRREKVPTTPYLVELNQRVQHRVGYLIRMEPGIQTPEHTLTCLTGSCRDSSWLLVQVLRHLGLAARFVSGYLIQLAPDVRPGDGGGGVAKDFTDLHAWVEVYLPGAGWIGLDPTSGLLAGEGHIPLACSADPSSAAAITGFFSLDNPEIASADPRDGVGAAEQAGGVQDDFEYAMSVTRLHEDPRVTKPYTDAQWAKIEALGHQVDADLDRQDVRLTMGGEPTFVALDHAEAPEWSSTALGPQKYRQGDMLARRLRDRFAPGGFIHHGQGKWYPGESLPRWALGIYWRKDGQPIWKNPALLADETAENHATEKEALAFAVRLAERLGVDAKHILPGYEDVWFYLWKEQRLPVNVDPHKSNLANAETRKRLARVFEQGLDKIVGYCLPLHFKREAEDGPGAWESGPWFFRPERMYLVPGDSPMGFRLPLESIPWVAPEDYPHLHDRDPWEARAPLPAYAAGMRQPSIAGAPEPRNPRGFTEQVLAPQSLQPVGLPDGIAPTMAVAFAGTAGFTPSISTGDALPTAGEGSLGGNSTATRSDELHGGGSNGRGPVDGDGVRPAPGESAVETVRTALCVQARDGIVRIFVPPQRKLEDYLDLIAAIEDTAAAMSLPVLVEGYTPPGDPRISDIKVTPDPGVIEINTHPVRTWDDMVKNTEALNDEARACGLGTEKFLLDGRHTGTGGGNHIVFGGETPADSPLLRRPDLLRSMLGYWHNHPSLSYLFSGMFVGPTSQAPRVDEARNDQVYELEIAFQQIPDFGKTPPWLVDRIFRNLLVDSTGNTHRAEFCIDKLYAPESPTGRLGLLEMRGFEMPPHPRMSLTQQLLLRAMIARFWREPYNQPLVRWRTEIHDRFLLPHFVRQDLDDVVADLNTAGYKLETDWFSPHLEFRFPLFGSIERYGIVMELRQAIEPWHVLGETPGVGSTVRQVDSSVERLQVLVDGMTDSRHKVTCNGIALPLHPTGVNAQYVAGVRYRAWQPPACLHPTIGVHSPLIFDVFDTWSGRSIGGCKYHVSHPGGRNYARSPVNAYEAESRRIARFFKFGHTPGAMAPLEVRPSKEFPLTLDLRRYLS